MLTSYLLLFITISRFLSFTYSQLFNFTIIVTGNIDGNVMPVDRSNSECSSQKVSSKDGYDCYGGAARKLSYIQSTKSKNNNTLVIDTGSAFWGNSFYTFGGSAFMGSMMAACNYDVIAISSTDFHGGPTELANFITQVKNTSPSTTFVSNNVDVSNEPLLCSNNQPLILPFKIVTLNNREIAIIASEDSEISINSSPGPNVIVNRNGNYSFSEMLQITKRTINLQYPNCNIFIWIAPVALDISLPILQVGIGIDIYLTPTPFYSDLSRTSPPTPSFFNTLSSTVDDPDIFLFAGVQSTSGATLLNLEVSFDLDGYLIPSLVNCSSILLDNSSVSPNTGQSQLWSQMMIQYDLVETYKTTTIGYTETLIDGTPGTNFTIPNQGCYFTDCPIGRLVTSAYKSWCQTCDFAFVNAGAFRGQLNKNISRFDVDELLPFKDSLVSFNLKGSTIIAVLNQMSSTGYGWSGYLQFNGLRFAWDPYASFYSRILEIQIYNSDTQDYEDIQSSMVYKGVTNNYLRRGGDGYSILSGNSVFNVNQFGPYETDILSYYISSLADVTVASWDELDYCITNASMPLNDGAGICNSVISTGPVNNRLLCPTNVDFCKNVLAHIPPVFSGLSLLQLRNISLDLTSDASVNSFCSSCSGLGTCFNQVCTCFQPSFDTFHGAVIIGSDCSIIRTVDHLQDFYFGLMIFFIIFTFLLYISTAVALYVFKGHKVIASTSPIHGILSCTGGLGACLYMIFYTSEFLSDSSCSAILWLLCLSFSLLFGSLYVRNYRIHLIFNSGSMEVVEISDLILLRNLGFLIIFESILLAYTQIFNPMLLTTIPINFNGEFSLYNTCEVENSWLCYGPIFLFKLIQTIWGVYIAIQVRNVQSNFNESRQIGLAIYNFLISGIICVPIISYLMSINPRLSIFLRVLLVGYIFSFTIVALYAKRFWYIYLGSDELVEKNNYHLTTPARKYDKSISTKDKVIILRLQEEIAQLKLENQKYKDVFDQFEGKSESYDSSFKTSIEIPLLNSYNPL